MACCALCSGFLWRSAGRTLWCSRPACLHWAAQCLRLKGRRCQWPSGGVFGWGRRGDYRKADADLPVCQFILFGEAAFQFIAFLGGLTYQLDVIDSNRGAVAVNVKFLLVGHEMTSQGTVTEGVMNTVLPAHGQRGWLTGEGDSLSCTKMLFIHLLSIKPSVLIGWKVKSSRSAHKPS